MGLRFRKSKTILPGVKLNIGKKGVGVSVGGKGMRYSVNTSGRKTSTVGIPGTGISYSKSKYSKKDRGAKAMTHSGSSGNMTAAEYNAAMIRGRRKLLPVVILFGWCGAHYFMMKRKGMGFLYLFTVGLCGIGWFVDIYRIAKAKPATADADAPASETSSGEFPKLDTSVMPQEQALMVRYQEAKAAADLMDLHYALNGLLEYYYTNREKSPANADRCIQFCQEDVDLYTQLYPLFIADMGFIPRLPAFQRLAMVYEQQGEYQKAIEVCELGIKHELADGTQGGFKARREKMVKKLQAVGER